MSMALSGAVWKTACSGGKVDERGGEGQLEGDAVEQQAVGEDADLAQ